MNSTGEKPQEVAAVLDAADQRHVRLLFDVAHYQQGGGDPVAAIRTYRDWIDVAALERRAAGCAGGSAAGVAISSWSWGADVSTCRACSRRCARSTTRVGESSSSIACPIPGGTPKESAEINKRYLVEKMHQTI